MFGGSNSSGSKSESDSKSEAKPEGTPPSPESSPADSANPGTGTNTSSSNAVVAAAPIKTTDQAASGEKRSGNGSPPTRNDAGGSTDKKRRSSGVGGKASSLLASAKNSLSFSPSGRGSDLSAQTPIQKLGRQDPALAVPQGQHNNSAGESAPGPRSTFRVGVWEDRNRKCRRTMEDTHAFLYNFLDTPATLTDAAVKDRSGPDGTDDSSQDMVESDNGYFAIFDGHAGTFAADWCGKKLHIILEDVIRKNPNVPIPELLDQTFTTADAQLEKLPLKNSGCTAAIAVLRWEDRVPSERSITGSQTLALAAATASKASKPDDASQSDKDKNASSSSVESKPPSGVVTEAAHARAKGAAIRQRILYTANVGDARIILCRSGKALRLSYDHKGGDENEGKRIANAGGLILNNRVNGVLAVTRALGDAYMKDLVTGHPYTTETVIQPDLDEFIIIACDGLWDVCSDQEAVDLVRNTQDPITASKQLVDHALSRFSTDNLSCMIVRLDKEALAQSQNGKGTSADSDNKVSEADKIVMGTKQKIAEGSAPAVGVSASNSGRGYDMVPIEDSEFVPTTLDGTVEEEPGTISDDDSPEVTPVANTAPSETKKPKKGTDS